MAYPHPTITFEVDLTLMKSENLGPLTNTISAAMLHPDRHDNSQDRAIASINQRGDHLSTWLPGLNAATNRALKHGDQFTVHGLDAIYIRDHYTIDNPDGVAKSINVLKVV
jgi:hypothetical protein